jgi:hypothetical protein
VVASLEQREHENYRVIVLARDRTGILVVPHNGHFQLPSIDIPPGQRTAESLCRVVKNELGCEAVCLFTLQDLLGGGSWENQHCQIMECWERPGTCNSTTLWAPIRSLSRQSFDDVEDYGAIEQVSAKLNLSSADSCLPFARPEWFRELRDWISEEIRPLGIQLTGRVRQFNSSPTFSLLRLETSGPAVWFKAVGEPNQREFGITLKLAELLPDYLPKIISTRPEWNGWLSFEAEGANLADTREISAWEKAATTLARLQIDSIISTSDIGASGARDLSAAALSDLLGPFFDVIAQLMKQQTKIPPTALNELELHSLEEIVQDSLTRMEDLSITDTIGHLDLNPGNIIVSPFECRFLDWAEAYIGNPIFSFEYLLEHFRRSAGADPAFETTITAAYIEEWHSRTPTAALKEALQLSPLLAAFAYAAGNETWRDQEKLNDPITAGYLRSLTRRMHREAKQLCERRSLCLC